MRSAGNFHPEWGYLAPAPSFMRTARIVLVAMAVGATAGAGVVLSLVGRPTAAGGEESVAVRTLARPVDAASMPVTAARLQAPAQGRSDVSSQPQGPAASESGTSSTAQAPAGMAALAEASAAHDAAPAITADGSTATGSLAPAADTVHVPRKAIKKHRWASHYPTRGGPLDRPRGGPLALLRRDYSMTGTSRSSYSSYSSGYYRDGWWEW